MTENINKESTTPMIGLNTWGVDLFFGNLIKSDGVNSLCWYTVNLENNTYVFDAMSIVEKTYGRNSNFDFGCSIDESVLKVQKLIEKYFTNIDDFSIWIKLNFYII